MSARIVTREDAYGRGFGMGAALRSRTLLFGVPWAKAVAPDPKALRINKDFRQAFVSGWLDGHAGRTAREPRAEKYFNAFQLMRAMWDVDHAALLAAEYDVIDATVSGMFGLLNLIQVSPKHAETVDLTNPIVVVQLREPDTGEDLGLMLIDGWHRLYRARSEGLTNLPAKVLDVVDSAAVLHTWH